MPGSHHDHSPLPVCTPPSENDEDHALAAARADGGKPRTGAGGVTFAEEGPVYRYVSSIYERQEHLGLVPHSPAPVPNPYNRNAFAPPVIAAPYVAPAPAHGGAADRSSSPPTGWCCAGLFRGWRRKHRTQLHDDKEGLYRTTSNSRL